jgi:small subunit ribosomal protein S1
MENNNKNPWEAPLDDSYWDALLLQEEFPGETVPPVDDKEVLRKLGAELVSDPSQQRTEEMPLEKESELHSAADDADLLEQDWHFCYRGFESGETLRLEVTGYNRGGLLVKLNHLQGFVPASQLTNLPRHLAAEERRAELASRVGAYLNLKILEIDQAQNRLILSERATLADDWAAEDIWDTLEEGSTCHGRVSNICEFGAFVDLGGVEGLIHISEMAWQRINHPRDVLNIGDEIEVYILKVDRKQQRVGLSLKRLQPDPWRSVEERYKVGQLVEGTITNVVSFGAFARIEDGLEGLIHISELAEGNFLHPRNVVKEGDVVTVRILNIDSARHRLGLSLRRAWPTQEKPPEPPDQWPYA